MRLCLHCMQFFFPLERVFCCSALCGTPRAPFGAINDDIHRDAERQDLLQMLRGPFRYIHGVTHAPVGKTVAS